jgi:RNase P subunit RPR2
MNRLSRNFQLRSQQEQNWLLKNTWCDNCNEADIGMKNPIEFEESGIVFVEGQCLRCGKTVRSEISEK